MAADLVTAALVIIGNEILSGRTQDANLPFLARELNEIGIQIREVRIVADEEAAIVEAVNACRARYHHVFTTGGIGPTHDDITSASVAKAVGRAYGREPEAERRLRAYYPPEKINAARLKMAEMPEGATLIDNPMSVAPGFSVLNVHVLPGVPSILQAMFAGLKPRLKGGARMHARTLTLFAPEGEVAAALAEVQARHSGLEIGSYPFMRQDRFGTSLVFRGPDPAEIDRACRAIQDWAEARGTELVELA